MDLEKNYDFHSYERRMNNLLKQIQRIAEPNRTLLLKYKQVSERQGLSLPRVHRLVSLMEYFARNCSKPFPDYEETDIDNAIELVHSKQRSNGTKELFRVALIKFFEETVKKESLVEYIRKWKIVKSNSTKLPEELLTEEEVQKIIDACENTRDRAICSLLWESGCRIGEIGNAKIKHLNFTGGEATLYLIGKTGARKVLLIGSVPHLKTWLQFHPHKENKEYALFTMVSIKERGKPVSYACLRKMLSVVMQKAEINKKFNAHLWRHSRATYLAGKLTEAQLCSVMGWKIGSEMPSVYIHLNQKDIADSIRKIYGMGKKEKEEESIMKPRTCEFCGEVNVPTEKECTKCSNPLTLKDAINRYAKLEEVEQLKPQALATIEELAGLVGQIGERMKEMQGELRELKGGRQEIKARV